MGKSKKQKTPRVVEQTLNDSDDEEISEDEAFNSDDERKYGCFFTNAKLIDDDYDEENHSDSENSGSIQDEALNANKDTGYGEEPNDDDDINNDDDDDDDDEDDDDDNIDDDDDDDDDAGGNNMIDILDKLDESKQNASTKANRPIIAAHVKESEFASSVVPKASLTLDSLMKGLEDTKGFGTVQKAMKKVALGHATPAPVSRVVSDRAQRKVHYIDQSKEVSLWMDAVLQNRDAQTLDFRPQNKMVMTRDVLIDKFVPTTDFEKQIHAALLEAGQEDDRAIIKAEEKALQDDLGANEITPEEYKKRQGQLAKMRALMFYHEQKMHHIKKIKSKKYRRIRKRQSEREKGAEFEVQAQSDINLANELKEKEEMDRMKERMTLAHKNTSKWARRVLKRGKNVDIDTRRALSAQLKRGDDLLKRMKSTRAGEDEEDSEKEEEDLLETAKSVLATKDDNVIGGKGLFELSFMQKGILKQREKAREEARQLLQELRASEELEEEPAKEDDNDMPQSKKVKMASRLEMENVLNEGEYMAKSLQFGNASALFVNGGIDVESVSVDHKMKSDISLISTKVSEYQTEFDTAKAVKLKEGNDEIDVSTSHSVQAKVSVLISSVAPSKKDESDSNPWLDVAKCSSKEEKKGRPTISGKKKNVINVERAVNLLTSKPVPAVNTITDKTNVQTKNEMSVIVNSNEKLVSTLTQEELVRRAFATLTEKEVDEEFALEKAEMEERDDPTRKQKKNKDMNTVSGWGSWAGKGAPSPRPPRTFPKHLQPPVACQPKRKRADEKKPNVIVQQKRIKKTADKYMIAQLPYPYTCREDYERAMIGGLGKEWNVTKSFKDMTRPEIITRAGKIIQPISVKIKKQRTAAKF